jgi:hypothetical protein
MTKKARKERCQAIIDANPVGANFAPHDMQEMVRLLNAEDQGILAIRKMVNPNFPDPRHLHVLRWEVFSWNEALTPPKPGVSEMKAMRKLIAEDIEEFRQCAGEVCEYCGSDENLQVDHLDPSFLEIATAFIDENGMPELIRPHPLQPGKRFADRSLEAKWIAFHASHAVYQVLCRSCNASKGSGKTVKRNIPC